MMDSLAGFGRFRWLRQAKSSRLFLFVTSLAIAAIYGKFGEPGYKFWDFELGYRKAGVALWQHDVAALASLMDDAKFVNIPIVAWLFVPFGWLNLPVSIVVFTALGLLSVYVGWRMLLTLGNRQVASPFSLLLVANGPLWYSVFIGNTTHFLLPVIVGALLLMRGDRSYAAGLLLGLAAVIKPLFLLFGPFLLLRRDWWAALGMLIAITLVVLASFFVCGSEINLIWWKSVVLEFLGRPVAAWNSQSIDSFLVRLVPGHFRAFDFDPHELPFALRLVRYGLVLTLIVLLALSLAPKREHNRDPGLLISMLLPACLITSTVSWTHYYLLLVIPFALYFMNLLPVRSDTTTRRLMLASLVLCSFPAWERVKEPVWLAATVWRVAGSIWILGAVLLLYVLFRSTLQPFWRRRESKGA